MKYRLTIEQFEPNPNYAEELKKWNEQQRYSGMPLGLEQEGAGTIENRQQFRNRVVVLSEYRFLPYQPLARDAAEQIPALPLFDNEGPWHHR